VAGASFQGWLTTRTDSEWQVDFIDREERVALRVAIEPFETGRRRTRAFSATRSARARA